MLLQGKTIAFTILKKNPIADYQQVTSVEILLDFQNICPSLDFIARKLRCEKSKCKQNIRKSDKMKKAVLVETKHSLFCICYVFYALTMKLSMRRVLPIYTAMATSVSPSMRSMRWMFSKSTTST